MFKGLPSVFIQLPAKGGNILSLNPGLVRASLPDMPGIKGGPVFENCQNLRIHLLAWHVINVSWSGSRLISKYRIEERVESSLDEMGIRLDDVMEMSDGFTASDLEFRSGSLGRVYLDRFMVWQGDLAMRTHMHSQLHWMRLSTFYLEQDLKKFDDRQLKEYREFAKDLAKEVQEASGRHRMVLEAKASYDSILAQLGAPEDEAEFMGDDSAEDSALGDGLENELDD